MKTNALLPFLFALVYSLSISHALGYSDNLDRSGDKYIITIDSLLRKASNSGDSLMYYAQKANELAKSKDSIYGEIKVLKFIDDYYYAQGNNQLMVNNLKKLRVLYEKVEDHDNVVRMYNYMCKPYRNMMKFDSLLYVFEKGVEVAIQHNNEKGKAAMYLEMGDYYSLGLQDPEKAIEYLMKALPYHKKDPATIIGLSRVYHDLGKNYTQLNKIDSVEKYSKLGIIAAEESGKESVIEILNSLRGDALSQQKRYSESIPFINKALSLAEKAGNKEAIHFNLNVMIVNYLGLGIKLNKIPELLDKAIDMTIDNTSGKKQLIYSHELKSKYFSQVGDYKNALASHKTMVELNKELNEHLKLQDLESLGQKYEIKEKQRELAFFQSKHKDQKTINILLFSLFGLFLLAGAIILRSFGLKSALNKKEIAVLRAEKQKEEFEVERIKALQRIQEEKNKVLKNKLEYNERELVSATLFITKKNEILLSIKEMNKKAMQNFNADKSELVSISNLIDKNLDVEDDWEAFKLRFEKVHPNFFTNLKNIYPKVNLNDSRLLGFIKMGMDNNEIARISGVNTASIYKARYRLRKKLNLNESMDLNKFANEMI